MKTLILAVSLMALPLGAQTASELLQKGIYTQETAGDLDGAIAIYHQIVNSGSSPRDVAAQAQYRLAQSLLQKGDLSNGAQEFSNLARNYADYGKLVSSLAAQARGVDLTAERRVNADRDKANRQAQLQFLETQRAAQQQDQQKKVTAALQQLELEAQLQAQRAAAQQRAFGGAMTPYAPIPGSVYLWPIAMSFDPKSTVSMTRAAIVKIEWSNPFVTVLLDPKNGSGKRYTFLLQPPNTMIRNGMPQASFKVGDEVTITGMLALGGGPAVANGSTMPRFHLSGQAGALTFPDGTIAALASTILSSDGRRLFERSTQSPPPCDAAAPPQSCIKVEAAPV